MKKSTKIATAILAGVIALVSYRILIPAKQDALVIKDEKKENKNHCEMHTRTMIKKEERE